MTTFQFFITYRGAAKAARDDGSSVQMIPPRTLIPEADTKLGLRGSLIAHCETCAPNFQEAPELNADGWSRLLDGRFPGRRWNRFFANTPNASYSIVAVNDVFAHSEAETSSRKILPPRAHESFDDVLAEYLRRQDAGDAVPVSELVGRYPQFAQQLVEFFAAQESLGRHGFAPRDAAREPSSTQTYLASTGDFHGSSSSPLATDSFALRPATARRQEPTVIELHGYDFHVFDRKAGGMGVVYLARAEADRTESDFVSIHAAFKTIVDFPEWRERRLTAKRPATQADYDDNVVRFRREALHWVQLGKHLHILHALHVHDHNAKPYIVLEYAAGGDLTHALQGGLGMTQAVSFAIQFCRGMQAAIQRSGLVHRDIKPANILLSSNNAVKIADFGLAKAFSGGDEWTAQLSADAFGSDDLSRRGAGTLPYMPPEQFYGIDQADTRSDIFSFGATLFEMVTGQRLLEGTNAREAMMRGRRLPLASQVRSTVPPRLSEIIARCVQFAPHGRYQSFDELEADLLELHATFADRCPLPTEDARDRAWDAFLATHERLAFSLEVLGQHAASVVVTEQGLREHPDDFSFWNNRGKALAEMERFPEAEACFLKAVEAGSRYPRENARAWTNLAFALRNQDRFEESSRAALQATQTDAQFALGWMARGVCERAAGRLNSAAALLERAVDLAPDDWRMSFNLATCLFDLDRRDEAWDHFAQAARLNPNHADTWYQLATIDMARYQEAQARAEIDRCLELAPDNADAWVVRATAFWYGEHDLSNARRSIGEALRLDPSLERARLVLGSILKDYGWALKDRERFEEALATFEEAARFKSCDAQIWFEIAWLNCSLANWCDARSAVDRALILDAGNSAVQELSQLIEESSN